MKNRHEEDWRVSGEQLQSDGERRTEKQYRERSDEQVKKLTGF